MKILDPDLWNDNGTARKPSQEYMDRLEQTPVFLHYAAASMSRPEGWICPCCQAFNVQQAPACWKCGCGRP